MMAQGHQMGLPPSMHGAIASAVCGPHTEYMVAQQLENPFSSHRA